MLRILPLLLLPALAFARDVDGLAQALVDLRQAVETLNDQVEEGRRLGADQRRALATQQAELDAERTRARLRVAQLKDSLEREKAALAAATAGQTDLKPTFTEAAGVLKARIQSGLNFKRAERLLAVSDIEAQVAEGLLPAEAALSRLWSVAEDELRLTRDTSLSRETVTLADGEVLADVVRLGLVGLYWRTGDGRVGVLPADKPAAVIQVPEQIQQVADLFEAFRKQIRVGAFALPTLLPEGG